MMRVALSRLALAACAAFVFAGVAAAQVSPRSRESFNDGWRQRYPRHIKKPQDFLYLQYFYAEKQIADVER